jgi:hypothetical protein
MTVARVAARLALRRPRSVIACAGLIVVVGFALASRLALQTDLAELLPPNAPSVIGLRALSDRVGGTGNVAIAIESVDGHPDALRTYVPHLASELRRQLGVELLSLRYRRTDVERFHRRYAAYYSPLADLEAWSRRVDNALATRKNPLYVDLGDGDELHDLADEVRAARGKLAPANDADPESGIFMTEGGRLAVVFVRPAADSLNLAGSAGLLDHIQHIVASTQPAAAGVRIAGYTGSIPTAITEVDAVRHDIVDTAIIVLVAVGGVLILYFRGVRELFVLVAPLVVGTAVALGFAELWIGHVNAQTAFLGSIIVGTGINYGIILLDRYRVARAEVDAEAALEAAIAGTLRATSIAALATAASFGVLAAGELESFRQFGWIGGIGILACWLATFTVIPACLALFPRREPRRGRIHPLATATAWFGRISERAPWVVVSIVAACAAGGTMLAIAARDHAVETDLRKLATRSSETTGIERLDNRLRPMDDRSSTPAVIATESREDTQKVCDLLNERARGDLHGVVVRCYSLADLFPQDLDQRQPVIAHLRDALADIDPDDIAADDRADLAELQRALAERPPDEASLPDELKQYFVERDGSTGKLAYVEPLGENIEATLYKFTDAIRNIRLPSGRVVKSSGDLVVFADVLRTVRRDSYRLTLAAALLVLLVLATVSRRAATTARVAGALLVGVAIMLGAAIVLGQRLNFFNFVALPTTFGIGIDYAINLEEAIRARPQASLAHTLCVCGPAVVLASLTSILGYASLLVADSRALSSFGALAITGEAACVLVAMTLIPAMWSISRRTASSQSGKGSGLEHPGEIVRRRHR